MGDQSGGHVRYDGPGSQWKSSWKGRKPFSEFCCFEGFARGEGGRYYQEVGGALNVVPATGYWLNFLVGIGAAPPAGVDQFIARNSAAPNGWDLIANRAVAADLTDGVNFTFRVYDGAVLTASVTSLVTYSLAALTNALITGPIGFRISALFLPPTGGFPSGQITIGVEGSVTTPFSALTAPYVNAVPDLLLGIGIGVPAEDFVPPQSICGLVGGEGNYAGVEEAAHDQWIDSVEAGSEIVSMPALVGGLLVPGYSQDAGWRGNNPYISPGVAPDPLASFIAGGASLVKAGGTGDLTTTCGTVTFFNDLPA